MSRHTMAAEQAAARADSPRALLGFQRTLLRAVTRPLGRADRIQSRWIDGRPMSEFADVFVRRNHRLAAVERLEIYNRMYWYRLLDCFHDDNPGLRALLGPRRFLRLAEAYLVRHPSSSFSLRDLCRRLPDFIRAEPEWTTPHTRLAWDLARFEWAQTLAFDEPGRPPLTTADLSAGAGRLRLALQPYLTLLALEHPVDEYVLAVRQRETARAVASQAVGARARIEGRRVRPPRRQRIWLAVHRSAGRVFLKRLEPAAFRVLAALGDDEPLATALSRAARSPDPAQIREWFSTWSQLGWLCRREASRSAAATPAPRRVRSGPSRAANAQRHGSLTGRSSMSPAASREGSR